MRYKYQVSENKDKQNRFDALYQTYARYYNYIYLFTIWNGLIFQEIVLSMFVCQPRVFNIKRKFKLNTKKG